MVNIFSHYLTLAVCDNILFVAVVITFGLVLQHSSAIILTISVIIIIVLVNYTVLFFLLSQSMPSERLRNQLTLMSTALHKSINKIQPEIIKVKYFKCSCT